MTESRSSILSYVDRESLIKPAERVRDLGEVFTPPETVEAMLDLLPDDIWQPHPSATFLEPACGDGNFLVAIIERKLERVWAAFQAGALPAGTDDGALAFHALETLASIYAVDISPENVLGGSLFRVVGARDRLVNVLLDRDLSDTLVEPARWIVERNILIGNMLPFDADGEATGREKLPLVEYRWNPDAGTVGVASTTLGAVLAAAEEETRGLLSLFALEPDSEWVGPPTELASAPIPEPKAPKGPARNGKARG